MNTFSVGSNRIHRIAYTTDGRFLIVDAREPQTKHPWMNAHCQRTHELTWWDWLTGVLHKRFTLSDCLKDEVESDLLFAPALELDFSINPIRIATVWEWTNKEDGVCVFDVEQLQVLSLRIPHKTHTERVAISPDGSSLVAAIMNDMDGSGFFEIWSTGEVKREPVEQPLISEGTWNFALPTAGEPESSVQGCENILGPLSSMIFDGRYLAVAAVNDPNVMFWDTTTPPPPIPNHWAGISYEEARKHVPEFEVGFNVRNLIFSPQSTQLVVCGDGLGLYDVIAKQWTRWDVQPARTNTATFDSGSQFLFIGTENGTVEVHNVATTKRAKSYQWNHEPISAIAISPDNMTCAAGTANGNVIVWDNEFHS